MINQVFIQHVGQKNMEVLTSNEENYCISKKKNKNKKIKNTKAKFICSLTFSLVHKKNYNNWYYTGNISEKY